MSGRKQHHIPQALLRGFADRGKGKAHRVTVYSRSTGVYVTSTEGVAAERDFYSDPAPAHGVATLDDRITALENRFGAQLMRYRELVTDSAVDSMDAAEFIVHLTLRAAHTRHSFGEGTGALMGIMADAVDKPDAVWKLLNLDLPTPGERMRRESEKAIDEHLHTLPIDREKVVQFIYGEVKRQMKSGEADLGPLIRLFVTMLQSRLPDMIRNAHNDALDRVNLAPEERISVLSQLRWEVRVANADSYVLPDCLAFAVGHSSTPAPLLLTQSTPLRMVWMPVAHDRVLVGRRGSPSVPSNNRHNELSASWSLDLFIGRSRRPEWEALTSSIGSNMRLWLENRVRSAGSADLSTFL